MSKKITALFSTVCGAVAIGFVGSMELDRISFEKGSVWGIILVFTALIFQSIKK